jgi:hypothetical protein
LWVAAVLWVAAGRATALPSSRRRQHADSRASTCDERSAGNDAVANVIRAMLVAQERAEYDSIAEKQLGLILGNFLNYKRPCCLHKSFPEIALLKCIRDGIQMQQAQLQKSRETRL